MKRKNIVAGNWKMHKNYHEGGALAQSIINKMGSTSTAVVLGTAYIHLKNVQKSLRGISNMYLAAQNCHEEEEGAYTGEISAGMLQSIGVNYVILGHSERREYFGEDAPLLAKKVDIVLSKGMSPIFCCGEKLDVREANGQEKLVKQQIQDALFHLSPEAFAKVVIAYEPVWAIGTGVTASPAQAQEMHAFIRKVIAEKYGTELADGISILYGGSVKPNNAKELFANPDVDGGLVGGASLNADDFVAIVNAFEE